MDKTRSVGILLLGLLILFSCDTDGTGENGGNDGIDDTQVAYSLYQAAVYDSTDTDGDGYASELYVSVDADVSRGSSSVYVVISYRSDGYTWYPLGTSDSFTITGTSTSDVQNYVLSGFDYDAYDLKIDLYDVTTDIFRDSYGPEDNPALSGVLLETEAEDTPQQVWLSYHDGGFEDSIYANVNPTTDIFPVYFEGPEDVLTWNITQIRYYITDVDVSGTQGISFDVTNDKGGSFLDPLTTYYETDRYYPDQEGWNTISVDFDMSDYDSFYLQYWNRDGTFGYGLGVDTDEPASGMCYTMIAEGLPGGGVRRYYVPTDDFGIEVLIEYTVAGLD